MSERDQYRDWLTDRRRLADRADLKEGVMANIRQTNSSIESTVNLQDSYAWLIRTPIAASMVVVLAIGVMVLRSVLAFGLLLLLYN